MAKKMMAKPSIDPVTGCAHIKIAKFFGGKYRACSNCEAEVVRCVDENLINYCWNCGAIFDHTDDDPKGDADD